MKFFLNQKEFIYEKIDFKFSLVKKWEKRKIIEEIDNINMFFPFN